MAARHYGPPPSQGKRVYIRDEDVLDGLPDPDEEEERGHGGWTFVAAFLVGLVLFGAFFCFIAYRFLGLSIGGSAPGQVAVSWVGAMTESEADGVLRYCPPVARSSGVMADTSGLNAARGLLLERHVSFPSRSIKDMEDIDEAGITLLEQGMQEMYGKKVNIKEATRVTVAAEMEWLDSEGIMRKSPMEFHIVCIKIHSKWYVYTGRAIDELDMDQVSIPDEETGDDGTDTGLPPVLIEPEPDPEPFVREGRELDFYDTARADLVAGSVEIEGAGVMLPAGYKAFDMLFHVTEGSEAEGSLLEPNTVMMRVPITLEDPEYATIGMQVGIANLEDGTVDLKDGVVTALFLSLPDDPRFAYPEVWLPGNVTFGTSLEDVRSMYGSLADYDGDNGRIVPPREGMEVYSVTLGGNRHNRLYLYFKDGSLWGMYWDYFDFNSYAGDIA